MNEFENKDPIAKLTTELGRLPGIGAKTALRLAYFILDMDKQTALGMATAIADAKERVHFCPVCGNYTEYDPCIICADTRRNENVLCVVQDARDILALERTREFNGRYHVLHGAISPMDGVGPDDLTINELLERVKHGGIDEIILATNPDITGEATASYIAKKVRELGVTVTRLAHGIPIGANLEYTDEVTLARALSGRREM